MRSKKRTIGILIVVIVVLLGFAGSLLIYRNKSSSENSINDSDIYTVVDKEMYETIVTDTFKNASLEERKEIAFNLLNKLESENRIKKGSIKFNEEYNIYFFEYLNGGEGSIILSDLENKDNDTSINVDNIENKLIESNAIAGVSNNNTDIYIKEFSNKMTRVSNGNINETYIKSFDNNATSYIKENLLKYDLTYYPKKALIVDDFGEDSSILAHNIFKEVWTSNNLITDIKSDITVGDFKTILNGYDFISIQVHGTIDENGNPAIILQENQNFFEDTKYRQDKKEGRVGTQYGAFGGKFYLKSSFFSHYYSNKLIDSIILIGSCKGYSNDTLVSAFANECNAKSVIAPTDTIWIGYDVYMEDIIVHKLLFGFTVDEALKEAKSLHGNNDEEWAVKVGKQPENTPAELKIYNGGNETLVELVPVEVEEHGTLSGTVTDESGNPIKNAGVLAIPNKGNTYKAITDDNGRFIINDYPVDSYRIEVSAEGYELYQSDEFLSTEYVVLEGQEPKSVTIQLKKIQKEYTETDLKEKVLAESGGNIGSWVYEDFDGNGTKEAYAVITGNHDSITECDQLEDIYFINDNGEITKMPGDFWGGLYYSREQEYEYIVCQGKGFFAVDSGNGGSGWQTLLYSVKDELPYELDISRTIQGFNKRDGIYYTTENEFLKEGDHKYTEVELIYNSSTQQFSKSNRIISQENNKISDWKSAYIEVLSNLNYSSGRFTTAYIDEDDIPELIVSYDNAHVAGCEIYTYYDGRVSKLESDSTNSEFGSSGEILYSPGENLFVSRYYGTGSNSDGLYRIKNGIAQLECALNHNDYFTTVRVIEFKIDGVEVTENEFWDKYNSYEIDSMVSANYDDMVEVNSTNISNYFNNINDAEFSGSGVIDEKKIFTKNQLDEINDNIRETAKNLNMNIMIYLGDSSGWSEEQTKRFADSTYDDIFGVDSDGVFYYMDLSEDSDAYDYISTSGIANNYYNGKIDDMFKEIFNYLPATGEPIVDTQIQSAIWQILLVFDEYHDSMPRIF